MPSPRVVVTGMGLVTPLSVGVSSSWRRLIDGQTGVVALEGPEFRRLPCRVAARVPRAPSEYNGENNSSTSSSDHELFRESDHVTSGERRSMSLSTLYALVAADEALTMSRWKPVSEAARCRTGVAVGTGMADLQDVAEQGSLFVSGSEEEINSGIPLRKMQPHFIPRILINMAAGRIALKYGFKGPSHAASTACATGAHAMGDAFRLICHGDADVMLAGGTEAPINAVSLAGFSKIRALATGFNETPELASRPFDAKRNGFVMGEGAGICVLERLDHALDRGADIYGEILGYGLTGDAHHITAPSADGDGAFRAMRAALAEARLSPDDIGYVNAHATSTPLGDAAECCAILKTFGEGSRVAVSSTKGAVGHLLGAAGAVEGIFSILACHHAILPPTINLKDPDKEFSLNYVANESQPWPGSSASTGRAMRAAPTIRRALNNSFGFGGTNACVCVGNYEG